MEDRELTEKIIKAAFNVHNILGAGFLEKVYHRALMVELRNMGLDAQIEYPISVYYKGHNVGTYFADILVEDHLIVEIKAVENLASIHEVQVVNYLAATGFDIGLLINFGSSVEIRRKYRVYRRQD